MKGHAPWFGDSSLESVRPNRTTEGGWPIDWRPIRPFEALLEFEAVEEYGHRDRLVLTNTQTGGARTMLMPSLYEIPSRDDRMVNAGRFWTIYRTAVGASILPCIGPWIVKKTGHVYRIRMMF
jgi:hypothetical protein